MTASLRQLFARFGGGKAASERALTETQRKLVAAGLELFADRGYGGATTREIAERAGVAEKTLFANFGDKQRLFSEVVYPVLLELMAPEYSAGIAAILEDPTTDFRRAAEAILKERARFVREHPSQAKFLARELLSNPEFRALFFESFRRRVWPRMKALISRAQKAGELRNAPPETILRMLLYVGVGYELTIAVLAPDQARDDDQEVAKMTELLFTGLSA